MNNNDYKEALFYAASIFNERLGAEFSEDNLVLCCFQTENQQEVFEQFCKQYFPDRLEDRYTEDGYFDFHASAFVGTGRRRGRNPSAHRHSASSGRVEAHSSA